MSLATAKSIIDRVRDIIELVDPISLTSTRFRRVRAENGYAFREAQEKAVSGALRRFHVRVVSSDDVPETTNMDFAEYRLELEVIVAYPQTNRAGSDGALDRADVMDQDWREIDYQIGLTGRGNFADSHDCTPLGCTKQIEEGQGVDFLVIRATYIYKRALSANGGLVGSLGLGLGG